jgi:hypothetical protein
VLRCGLKDRQGILHFQSRCYVAVRERMLCTPWLNTTLSHACMHMALHPYCTEACALQLFTCCQQLTCCLTHLDMHTRMCIKLPFAYRPWHKVLHCKKQRMCIP